MKSEITLYRETIELLIKALEVGAFDSNYEKGKVSMLRTILTLFEEEGK